VCCCIVVSHVKIFNNVVFFTYCSLAIDQVIVNVDIAPGDLIPPGGYSTENSNACNYTQLLLLPPSNYIFSLLDKHFLSMSLREIRFVSPF
jgi:hypothetical protein